MQPSWLKRSLAHLISADEVEFRVRVFRLICALTGGLCLLLVAPLNAFQTLPAVVHGGNLALGLLSVVCWRESLRGRHHVGLYLGTATLLVDLVWFWNAGSDGSVTYYYPLLLISVLVLFNGLRRLLFAVGVLLNVAAIHLIEYYRPEWVVPFHNREDRILDLLTGQFCSYTGLACVLWIVLAAYEREQQRVSGMIRQLAAQEADYREIFDSSSDALLVLSAEGRVLAANEQAGTLFMTGRQSLQGRTFGESGLGTGQPATPRPDVRVQAALQGRSQLFETCFQRTDEIQFWAEVALRAWGEPGAQRLVASIRDITTRRNSQEALRLNEERLRLAMAASGQGWFELNVRSGAVVTSPEYARILGYEPAEFRGSLQAWLERIHPADRASVVEAYQRNLRTGDLSSFDYRLRTKDGDWKWIHSVAQVVERGPAGEPLRMMGTHADITERKELEGQLLHRQRLEAVGTLASGVAHDLNNVLSPVLMASSILREKLTDASDRELMAMLDDGGRRGAAIVRQLLDFSRNLAENRVPVDPRQIIQEVAQLVRSTFPKEIQLTLTLTEVSGVIEAEPNQLHQVLVNLCVNARDAMDGRGTITLGLDRLEALPAGGRAPEPHLVLSVADTGPGVPVEIRDKIFDPFFTTKPMGKGTGLGLATVHGIIKAHQGFVRLGTAPGGGALFQVFLPARDRTPVVTAPRPPASSPTKANAPTVLVVDDEPSVRLASVLYLQRMGCRVIEAASGQEAIDLIRQQPEAKGIVITDFSMPGMDGPTLVPHLRKIKPGWSIIGVSGLDQSVRLPELRRLGFAEVLAKPYEAPDLWQAVCRHHAAASSNGA